ncbi:MAG: ribonuclease E/G [Alphaproteobacteria bacterium]|nr:ribonuclease E/G [Alphaproteobacteria bacterium]
MTKKMLIDATHTEEMRVVVVDGTRLDELDIETSTKKQLKGNIYLAKVARVEPSLQAAFVDYGGNRHGFLAFNEIHPDYYQIPVADREALKEALLQEESEEEEEEEKPKRGRRRRAKKEENAEAQPLEAEQDPSVQEEHENEEGAERFVETVSENESDEMIARNRYNQIKHYKIQEVIHRGQVLLVQVIKEERGNKGAALTTYLSLAGRYCVLMPNNARGGGVSRKITNAADRKRLKSVVSKLPLPTGMSVIVRTAGKERTSLEIKRDYEYLIKTWVQIRDKTMESSAPTLIHEEGNLIKRALRDMYTRDISEVLIEGDTEYRMAKDFMKILTPSHAKKIKQYKDDTMPLFFRYQVESQLEALHSNIVQLKSGAYLVMDQTEALVAIDVNSGRATKERNIEETALKTNLEAADEIARQLRLRDMAGLVVIDFIDMEESRNNHAVERRMKEALKRDRARVQMGRITGFGLMELSRQRLHSSFIETSYSPCPYCKGKGMMRSTESVSIHTLHVLEEESLKRRFSELHMTVPTATALYVLNKKREDLHKIETAYNVRIFLETDDTLMFPTDYRMERVVRVEPDPVAESAEAEEENETAEEQKEAPVVQSEKPSRERRRRRNRRDRQAQERKAQEAAESVQEEASAEEEEEVIQADEMFEEGLKSSQKPEEQTEEHQDKNNEGKRRRRGRFMHRNRRFHYHRHENAQHEENGNNSEENVAVSEQQGGQEEMEGAEKPVKKTRRRYNRRRRAVQTEESE